LRFYRQFERFPPLNWYVAELGILKPPLHSQGQIVASHRDQRDLVFEIGVGRITVCISRCQRPRGNVQARETQWSNRRIDLLIPLRNVGKTIQIRADAVR
jgi:hypothetical protein